MKYWSNTFKQLHSDTDIEWTFHQHLNTIITKFALTLLHILSFKFASFYSKRCYNTPEHSIYARFSFFPIMQFKYRSASKENLKSQYHRSLFLPLPYLLSWQHKSVDHCLKKTWVKTSVTHSVHVVLSKWPLIVKNHIVSFFLNISLMYYTPFFIPDIQHFFA